MSRENGRRRHFPLGKIVLLCLLVPAAYVALQLYHITRDTYEYETAIRYSMSDSMEADGLVLFDETPVEGGGNLGYLVADGERVSAGTQLAEVYTDDSQAGVRTQLDALDAQIALLQKSQNTSSTQVDVLITARSTAIYDLLEGVDRHKTAELAATREDYLLAQNKLQITTGEAKDFSAQIADLAAQRDSMAGQLSALAAVTAPAGGYFVSSASCQILNTAPADVLAMSAGDLTSLLQTGALAGKDGLAGMIVPSYTWQFCGVCTAAQAEKFAGVKSVTVSFPGKAETKLPATVVSVETDDTSGMAKFVLQCEYISADVLKLGQETAQIDFTNYDGLRISTSAIHLVRQEDMPAESAVSESAASGSVSSPAESSASSQAAASSAPASSASSGGAAAQDSDFVTGVYVKYGNLARFRRIEILYQDPKGEYILIAPDGALGTGNEVRLYDEVIVAGTNLYDGKLL
ncbi:MAG: hypothetical protein LKJ90_03325 [Faecalibacterium sp.]|jgi:hypothetical protein|nr:hypothetical protein [Faecalibacterium sp.]